MKNEYIKEIKESMKDKMKEMNLLNDLPDSNQLSLF